MFWISLQVYFLVLLGPTTIRVYGNLQLTSSIPLFSGELCPQIVTLTCDANLSDGTIIYFGSNDTIIASYSLQAQEQSNIPVSVESPIENVTVHIAETTRANGRFIFDDFTLSADLSDMTQFVGQEISCGTHSTRSDPIKICSYNISGEGDSLAVNTFVTYSGSTNQLQQINVTWNIVMCRNISIYTVELYSNTEELVNQTVRNTDECIEGKCEVVFHLKNGSSNFRVVIVAQSQNLNATDNLNSSTIIMGTAPNILQVDGCTVSINCSGFSNNNCFVSNDSNNFMDPYTLQSTDIHFFSLDVDIKDVKIIEVRTQHNSVISIITYRLEDYRIYRRDEAVVGIGAAAYAIAICLVIVACIVEISRICKTKERLFQAISLIFGAILILISIVTLAVWITVGAGYSAVSCSNEENNGQILMWIATGLSLLLLALSVVFLGSVLVFYGIHQKNKHETHEILLENQQYSFEFFMEKMKVKKSPQCYNCESGELGTVEHQYCQGCGTQLCEPCYLKNKAIIWRNFRHGGVCKTCIKQYINDNKQLITHDIKGIRESLRQDSDNLCDTCHQKVIGQVQKKSKEKNNPQESVEEGGQGIDYQEQNNQQGDTPKSEEKHCQECNNVLCSTPLCYNQEVKTYCALCFVLKKRKEDACKEDAQEEHSAQL